MDWLREHSDERKKNRAAVGRRKSTLPFCATSNGKCLSAARLAIRKDGGVKAFQRTGHYGPCYNVKDVLLRSGHGEHPIKLEAVRSRTVVGKALKSVLVIKPARVASDALVVILYRVSKRR